MEAMSAPTSSSWPRRFCRASASVCTFSVTMPFDVVVRGETPSWRPGSSASECSSSNAQRIGGFEIYEPIAGGRVLDGASSRHTVVVEAAASVGQALSADVRLIATDIFHDFGSPEVRQIAADGTLRTRYWGGNGELSAWAQQYGIEVSGETLADE